MKNATERYFNRLDRRHSAYSETARPYVTIGALKATIEILANKFPEVEQQIADLEDFMERHPEFA